MTPPTWRCAAASSKSGPSVIFSTARITRPLSPWCTPAGSMRRIPSSPQMAKTSSVWNPALVKSANADAALSGSGNQATSLCRGSVSRSGPGGSAKRSSILNVLTFLPFLKADTLSLHEADTRVKGEGVSAAAASARPGPPGPPSPGAALGPAPKHRHLVTQPEQLDVLRRVRAGSSPSPPTVGVKIRDARASPDQMPARDGCGLDPGQAISVTEEVSQRGSRVLGVLLRKEVTAVDRPAGHVVCKLSPQRQWATVIAVPRR